MMEKRLSFFWEVKILLVEISKIQREQVRMKVAPHKGVPAFSKGFKLRASRHDEPIVIFVNIVDALENIFPFWSLMNFIKADPFGLDSLEKTGIFLIKKPNAAVIPVKIGLLFCT